MTYSRRSPQTTEELLANRIKQLEAKVEGLISSKRPTVPIYDSGTGMPSDAVEGQMVVDISGVGGASYVDLGTQATYSGTIDLLGGTNGAITFNTADAGTEMFTGASLPGTAPAFIRSGIYAVSLTLRGPKVSGKSFDIAMDINGTISWFGASDFPMDGTSSANSWGTLAIPAWYAAAGDTLDATIWNGDVTEYNFSWYMYIQQIR